MLEQAQVMLRRARAAGYAIGYFESWNLESLQGAIDAAEQTRSPIILGFNGEFLTNPKREAVERINLYAALGRAAAESAGVPCALIFNECPWDDQVRSAIAAGFNLIVPTDPAAPYAQYVQRVAALTREAHARGVAVEAELGELPCGASGSVSHVGSATDPDVAADFVRQTDVDLLAVSCGNVHILVKGEQELDLDRLARIREKVSVPLVLHGGSGIAAASLKKAIAMGVAKVNYGTYVKQRYLRAVRAALSAEQTNPHQLLGMGGADDVLVAGRRAVRDAVLERIEVLGCCGRA